MVQAMLWPAMLEGLPPNNAAFVMRLACDEALARAVSDIIVETFDPADTAAAAFEVQATTQHWGAVPWAVEVYFGHAPGAFWCMAAMSAAGCAAMTLHWKLRQRWHLAPATMARRAAACCCWTAF